MTDRHHQLDNVTPIRDCPQTDDNRHRYINGRCTHCRRFDPNHVDVCCAYCDRPIHEAPADGIVVAQGRRFCNEFCLAEYVYDAAKTKARPRLDHIPDDPVLVWKPNNPNYMKADKTPARKAADSAAAFIGFFVWLAVISLVAVILGIPLLL